MNKDNKKSIIICSIITIILSTILLYDFINLRKYDSPSIKYRVY